MTTLHLGEFYVKEKERNSQNRRSFRMLARDVCREIFDIPEENKVLFAYQKFYSKETLIGGITFQLACKTVTSPGVNFDTEYFNQITFMFVKMDFQGFGVGRMLLDKALNIMEIHCKRPVRVQSAEKACGFFEKMGFVCLSDRIESLCGGAKIFKYMYNMEKPCETREMLSVT